MLVQIWILCCPPRLVIKPVWIAFLSAQLVRGSTPSWMSLFFSDTCRQCRTRRVSHCERVCVRLTGYTRSSQTSTNMKTSDTRFSRESLSHTRVQHVHCVRRNSFDSITFGNTLPTHLHLRRSRSGLAVRHGRRARSSTVWSYLLIMVRNFEHFVLIDTSSARGMHI